MMVRCAVLGVVATVAGTAPAWGQESGGSVAVGVGLERGVLREECPFGDCGPVITRLSGEGAVNVTDSVGIVGRVWVTFAGSNPVVEGGEIDAKSSGLGADGGVRMYWRRAGVRPFVQFTAGFRRISVTVSGLGFLASSSGTGFLFSPGAGVEMAIWELAGLRLLGEWSINNVGWVRTNSVGASVGLVFGVGRR